MLHVTLITVVITAFALQDKGAQAPADRNTYEAVRKKAGQDPAALVKLALVRGAWSLGRTTQASDRGDRC